MKDLAVVVPGQRRPALRITRFIAVAYAVVAAITSCFIAGQYLLSKQVQVSLPLATYFPKINSTLKLDGTSATFAGGGYDHASLALAGLHWDARGWLAAGTLLQGATAVIIALTLAMLCTRVAAGEPFARSVIRGVTRSAIAILVGGLLWQLAFEFGQHFAFTQTFLSTGSSWTNTASGITPFSPSWPREGMNFTIDFWPIGISLALFALAAVFRYGEGLQAHTLLLHHRNAELKRETEGLV
jgi:ABC-type sugar transport system permease subunit